MTEPKPESLLAEVKASAAIQPKQTQTTTPAVSVLVAPRQNMPKMFVFNGSRANVRQFRKIR
jgi:hypothetical protein